MTKRVSLRGVVDGLEMANDQVRAYLNLKTGQVIPVSEDDLSAAEEDADVSDYPEWQQEMTREVKRVLDSGEYLELPDKYEVNEYGIMEDFCYSIEDERLREELFDAISGNGAFRRFNDTIRRRDIEDHWYGFRQQRFETIAIRWLKAHRKAYIP